MYNFMSILVRRGQDQRPVLNSHHLYTSRLQCIKTKHNSVVEINAWALEPLLKSNATFCLHMQVDTCLYHAQKQAYVKTKLGQRLVKMN